MTNEKRITAEDLSSDHAARTAELNALELAHAVRRLKYDEISYLQDQVLALYAERKKFDLPYSQEFGTLSLGDSGIPSNDPDLWLEWLRPAVVRMREINAQQKRAKGITE